MKKYTAVLVNERQVQNPVCGVYKPWDRVDEDDSEEDSEDEFQNLSFKEMKSSATGGKRLFQRKKQKKVRGTLVDERVRRKADVEVGFHLTDPWWRIQVFRTEVKRNGTHYTKESNALSYQLLEKEWVVKKKLLYQYLNKCMVKQTNDPEQQENNWWYYNTDDYAPNPEVTRFYEFVCETLGQPDKLTFEDVGELMEMFEDYLPEEEKETAQRIRHAMDGKGAQVVYRALTCPLVFSLLPQLLPMQFLGIICMEEADVDALEKDLQDRPWVFGFKQILSKDHNIIGCESQWEHFGKAGLHPTIKQPYRDGLMIYDFLKVQSKNGHTGVRSRDIQQKMLTFVSNYDQAISFLKRNKVVKEEKIEGVPWIFLYHLYKAEEFIATRVTHLLHEQMENRWILDVDFDNAKFDNIRNDEDQLRAARLLTQLPVVVISGKGGCGKTTVVTKVMSSCEPEIHVGSQEIAESGGEEMDEKDVDVSNPASPNEMTFPRILYTAPTGKAANILGKRAGKDGFTLHQVTFSFMMYCKTRKKNPEAEWKFKHINTLVVDECSLVAITTFHSLFKMLVTEACLRRIVLLGDVRQLPSIEPGNFLSDMFAGLQNLGCAVELRTNHRSESQLIIDNATKISQQRSPTFDPKRNFKLHRTDVGASDEFLNNAVKELLRREKSLLNDKTSQFISFRNKDIKKVNEVCVQFYNNHPQMDNKNKPMFRTNDKICMTRNSRITLYEESNGEMKPVKRRAKEEKEEMKEDLNASGVDPENGHQDEVPHSASQALKEEEKIEEIRLCNGEVFFIKQDKTIIDPTSTSVERYIFLSNEDPEDLKQLWCKFGELRKFCKIRHAWARTIHTFQGSETGAVVYYLGPGVSWQNWQHVYTAVTRGKKEVHILGSEAVLARAIAARPNVRWTSLKYQLQKRLPDRDRLNQSLHALSEDTENSTALPYTQTNSFTMDNPEDETFQRVMLSPRKPSVQSPRVGSSSIQPPSSPFVTASNSYRPRPLNFSTNMQPNSRNSFQSSKSSFGQHSSSTPLVRHTASTFNPVSPVPRFDSPLQNKDSNESQWSEVDESMLLISEEQAINESLLANCGPLQTGGRNQEKTDGNKLKTDEEGEESDATQSSDEEMGDNIIEEREKITSRVIKIGYSSLVQQDRLPEISPRKREICNGSAQRKKGMVEDEMYEDLDDENDSELSRLCEVAERTFPFPGNDDITASESDSEDGRDSPSLLLSGSFKAKGKTSNSDGAQNDSNFHSHRSVTENEDLFDDSDDDRSSPSLLSSSQSPSRLKRYNEQLLKGEVTPKKRKTIEKESLASPMRRKLDNLSMSQD